jgi:hypothetical protein
MRVKRSRSCCGIVLACLIVGGCQKPNTVLTAANYRLRFDQAEDANRQRPGELGPNDLAALLGPGELVRTGDADLASMPSLPGVAAGNLKWVRWGYLNEVLLVGFIDDRVSMIGRLRR